MRTNIHHNPSNNMMNSACSHWVKNTGSQQPICTDAVTLRNFYVPSNSAIFHSLETHVKKFSNCHVKKKNKNKKQKQKTKKQKKNLQLSWATIRPYFTKHFTFRFCIQTEETINKCWIRLAQLFQFLNYCRLWTLMVWLFWQL